MNVSLSSWEQTDENGSGEDRPRCGSPPRPTREKVQSTSRIEGVVHAPHLGQHHQSERRLARSFLLLVRVFVLP